MSAPEPSGIELDRVAKRYGSTPVLAGVTATLEHGKVYGLLGANGSGKSTLMSLIARHRFPTAGHVIIDGLDPATHPSVLERVCCVHEDQPWSESLTIDAHLRVLPQFCPDWSAATAERLMERFRLPRSRSPKKLSRGQRSAFALVCSLASRAPYTLLDEPYLGLDPTARTVCYDEILRAQSEHPRMILLSTHFIDEAANLMDEVLVLHEGRIALRTSVEDAAQAAFVVRGLDDEVAALVGDREVLSERRMGRIRLVTVRGRPTAIDERRAAERHLDLEPTSLQEFVAALGLHDAQPELAEVRAS